MRATDNAGMGVVLFDTQKNAEAAVSALKPPPARMRRTVSPSPGERG